MMMDKPVTVRLRNSQLREMMAFAVLDDRPLADLIRAAIDEYVERRGDDPELPRRIEEAKARQSTVLDALVANRA